MITHLQLLMEKSLMVKMFHRDSQPGEKIPSQASTLSEQEETIFFYFSYTFPSAKDTRTARKMRKNFWCGETDA